jgi:hypothetical protein
MATVVEVSPVVSWNADAGIGALLEAEIAVVAPPFAAGRLPVDEQAARVTATVTPTSTAAR